MALRWELMAPPPDKGRAVWYLLDGEERLAMLFLQQGAAPILTPSGAWQRVEIVPETWQVAAATLELFPGIQVGRLSHVQLPPIQDGPLALTLPPLP